MELRILEPTLCDADCPVHPTTAMWHVGVMAGEQSVHDSFIYRNAAQTWLTDQIDRIQASHHFFQAPDHDGVVVMPNSFARTVEAIPALAVRVREASPMAASPALAAQVTERVRRARELLADAAEMASGVDGAAEWATMCGRAVGRIDDVFTFLGCDVYSVGPVEPVTPGERHLEPVPDLPEATS
ncbi:hypothetical protein LGT39_05930 [Demequina sp. TTPB684]|uniref:hypothetical protein n=1 Tax=unclassified Demequina TaxID=2620311 RepID=UPI001CF51DA6|nr:MULTISPECIES: hypothetical protein [unclassified Demequina]MCB2412387.1 hypothetical protein [Demequina sp. TTPB684]UPU89057.1 hypothetical protein LGT36_003785 [Demequina sp. TMPB413]